MCNLIELIPDHCLYFTLFIGECRIISVYKASQHFRDEDSDIEIQTRQIHLRVIKQTKGYAIKVALCSYCTTSHFAITQKEITRQTD